MARGFGFSIGAYHWLIKIISDHFHPFQRDILNAGHHLRDLTWTEAYSFCCIPDASSNLFKEFNGGWNRIDHMLADIIDLQTLALWFKTVDGVNNKNRPKPYPRPQLEPEVQPTEAVILGKKADIISIDEFKARMANIGVKKHGI